MSDFPRGTHAAVTVTAVTRSFREARVTPKEPDRRGTGASSHTRRCGRLRQALSLPEFSTHEETEAPEGTGASQGHAAGAVGASEPVPSCVHPGAGPCRVADPRHWGRDCVLRGQRVSLVGVGFQLPEAASQGRRPEARAGADRGVGGDVSLQQCQCFFRGKI